MKYYSKKTRKKKKKMIEYHSKENLSVGQLERIEKLKAKRDRLLSRGGKIERSHNKRVGNAVNKNIDKRYDAAGKAIERIEGKRKLKEDIDKNSDKYTAYYIYNKGIINNNFDFKKGFEELIKKDKDGKWICRAGKDWDQFDFKKGLDKLIQKDKKGEDIYLAGRYWNQFDYKKGLNSLKNTNYYQRALNDWPKGIDKVKEITKELRDTSTKLPNKKMKLKEEWADTVKFGSKTYEIFKNPSQKEINDIIKNDDLRYIIDGKEKAVYVFPATLLHLNAASQLGLDYDYFSNGKTIFGIDDKIQAGEKITIVGNHQRQFVELLKTQTNTEWLWKYIKKPKGLIKEEWVQSTKANKGRTYEIFKNPTRNEIQDLKDKFGSIRFIVDGKNKNIYMFSASLLHNEAIMTLKLEYNSIDNVYGVSSETPPGKPLEASNNDDKQALRRLSKKYKTDWVWKYIKKPTYVKMDKTMSLEEK